MSLFFELNLPYSLTDEQKLKREMRNIFVDIRLPKSLRREFIKGAAQDT